MRVGWVAYPFVVAPNSMKPAKAVFLDRDGTLIVNAHYLSDPDGVVPLPGARNALLRLRKAGFLLFVLTNQSGVGRGLFSLDAVHRCNRRMVELFGLGEDLFAEVGVAPEAPGEPVVYRKPSPRFINECVDRYTLDRARCWMVGDAPSDVEAGLNAGVNAAYLSAQSTDSVPAHVPRFDSLYAFSCAVAPDVADPVL